VDEAEGVRAGLAPAPLGLDGIEGDAHDVGTPELTASCHEHPDDDHDLGLSSSLM
jgi:hypothetical protein